MRLLKITGIIFLSAWMVFVTMGVTIYQHVCKKTGEIQISVNEPVECKFKTRTEPNNCCEHHKGCSKEETKDDGCCERSQLTIYIDVKKQEFSTTSASLILFTPVVTVNPVATLIKDSYRYERLLRPPPLIRCGFDVLLQKDSFLI